MVSFMIEDTLRAVASLTVPGGQEFHFPHFFPKFWSFFSYFPQISLIFFLILALRVGDFPTREGPGYATGYSDIFYGINSIDSMGCCTPEHSITTITWWLPCSTTLIGWKSSIIQAIQILLLVTFTHTVIVCADRFMVQYWNILSYCSLFKPFDSDQLKSRKKVWMIKCLT